MRAVIGMVIALFVLILGLAHISAPARLAPLVNAHSSGPGAVPMKGPTEAIANGPPKAAVANRPPKADLLTASPKTDALLKPAVVEIISEPTRGGPKAAKRVSFNKATKKRYVDSDTNEVLNEEELELKAGGTHKVLN